MFLETLLQTTLMFNQFQKLLGKKFKFKMRLKFEEIWSPFREMFKHKILTELELYKFLLIMCTDKMLFNLFTRERTFL